MIKMIKTCTTALCLLAFNQAYSEDVDQWQLMQLLEPAETMLVAEANGLVNIYDGLPMGIVDRALDEQFERIDNMMFIRVRHDTPAGEVVEDDGC